MRNTPPFQPSFFGFRHTAHSPGSPCPFLQTLDFSGVGLKAHKGYAVIGHAPGSLRTPRSPTRRLSHPHYAVDLQTRRALNNARRYCCSWHRLRLHKTGNPRCFLQNKNFACLRIPPVSTPARDAEDAWNAAISGYARRSATTTPPPRQTHNQRWVLVVCTRCHTYREGPA